jgi:murein DD-endopeptidase MepM/ murein hydrolase activator NlpD
MRVNSKISSGISFDNKAGRLLNFAASILGISLMCTPVLAYTHHKHYRQHHYRAHVHHAAQKLRPSYLAAAASQHNIIQNEGLFINELVGHSHSSQRTLPPFSLPVDGQITSFFGLRRFENEDHFRAHNGIDIAVPDGTPIHAAAPGKVVNTGNYFYTGKTVFIDHGHGLVTVYAHLHRIDVRRGQNLRQGQILGLSGRTGLVTGPHLHWGVVLNGVRVNPMRFLANKWQDFRHLSHHGVS